MEEINCRACTRPGAYWPRACSKPSALRTHTALREAAAQGQALRNLAEKDARNDQQLSTCKRFTQLWVKFFRGAYNSLVFFSLSIRAYALYKLLVAVSFFFTTAYIIY